MTAEVVNLILVLRCVYNPQVEKNLFAVPGTLVLMTIFFTPSVYALGFGAHAEYWIPTFKGDLRVDGNGVEGTEINLNNDLGISNENFPGVEAFFGVGNHELRLMNSSVYDNKKDIHVPIPMIGLGAKIGLLANILEARAKFVGMGYSGSFFYDAMADFNVTPFPFLNIHGGYRAMSLKIDDVSDIYATMDFYGPYAGLAISF
ncbi:hypothetical protein ER57_06525 [Smithella sp. SCADC]|nr:hypothetical protein ER57_06525 [Smithella sp. SCADC]HAR49957.1 hypothetical protein [Smithella sp.]